MGAVRLTDPTGRSVRLRTRKLYELLARLADAQGAVLRLNLAEALWPDVDRIAAKASLRNAISGLVRLLGPTVLQVDRETVEINRELLSCDELILVGTYPGDFMPGFNSDWILDRRISLRESWMDHQILVAETLVRQGLAKQAIGVMEVACQIDPLYEPAAKLHVELLVADGQRTQAAIASDRHRGRVWQALGLDSRIGPSPAQNPDPLLGTAGWLIDISPETALEFLASTGGLWPGRSLTQALNFHRQVLGQTGRESARYQEVRANLLYLEWAAGELGDKYLEAEATMKGLDPTRDTRLAYRLGSVGMYGRLSSGDFTGAVRTAKGVLGLASHATSLRFEGDLLLNVGIIHFHCGRQPEGAKLMRQGAELLLEHGDAEQAAGAAHIYCQFCAGDGRLDLAWEHLAHSQRYFKSSGAVRGAGWSSFAEAELLYGLGELNRAKQILDCLIQQGIPVLGHSLVGVATDLLGKIYADQGEFGPAASQLIGAVIWRRRLGLKSSILERESLAPSWQKIHSRLTRSDLSLAYERARMRAAGSP